MRFKEKLSEALTKLRGPRYISSLYSQMHAAGEFPGHSWRAHVATLRQTIPGLDSKVILDFGCGPRGGLAECFGEKVLSYDPYVEKYSALPWGKEFDVVFSTDVLEHMTSAQIDKFLTLVRHSGTQFVFLNVSTRTAYKQLPNGANAHLTVKPASWWSRKIHNGLGRNYEQILAQEDLLRNEAIFCFRRSTPKDVS